MTAPLLKAEEKLKTALIRLFKKGPLASPTLAIEEEFFLVDLGSFLLRPDLVQTGRTLFGAPFQSVPPFSPPERINDFIQELNRQAAPIQVELLVSATRKAPSHYCLRLASQPISLALEKYLHLHSALRLAATKYNLAPLFHEKPFRGLAGSQHLLHWSLESSVGNPILKTAIYRAFAEHACLLGAESGSASLQAFPRQFSFEQGKQAFCSSNRDCAQAAFQMALVNASVALNLELLLDEIGERPIDPSDLHKFHKPYEKKTALRFAHLLDKKTAHAFEGIFSEEELKSLYHQLLQQYVDAQQKELHVLLDIYLTSLSFSQTLLAETLFSELKKLQSQSLDMGWEAKQKVYAELIEPKKEQLCLLINQLEKTTSSALWPLPKYKDLLFL